MPYLPYSRATTNPFALGAAISLGFIVTVANWRNRAVRWTSIALLILALLWLAAADSSFIEP